AFRREPHEDERFTQRADDWRQGTLGIMRVWAAYSPAMSFAGSLGFCLVLWLGGRQVLQGEMSLGALVGFMFYLGLFYEPISRLHGLNQMLQAARAAGERVFDILDATEENDNPKRDQRLRIAVRGEIIFDQVSFNYTPDRPVLRGISLHAMPAQMIALV